MSHPEFFGPKQIDFSSVIFSRVVSRRLYRRVVSRRTRRIHADELWYRAIFLSTFCFCKCKIGFKFLTGLNDAINDSCNFVHNCGECYTTIFTFFNEFLVKGLAARVISDSATSTAKQQGSYFGRPSLSNVRFSPNRFATAELSRRQANELYKSLGGCKLL